MLPSKKPKPPLPFAAQPEPEPERVPLLTCPVDNAICTPTGGTVSGNPQYVARRAANTTTC